MVQLSTAGPVGPAPVSPARTESMSTTASTEAPDSATPRPPAQRLTKAASLWKRGFEVYLENLSQKRQASIRLAPDFSSFDTWSETTYPPNVLQEYLQQARVRCPQEA